MSDASLPSRCPSVGKKERPYEVSRAGCICGTTAGGPRM